MRKLKWKGAFTGCILALYWLFPDESQQRSRRGQTTAQSRKIPVKQLPAQHWGPACPRSG